MRVKKILKRITFLTISIMVMITIVFQSHSEAAFTLTDIKKGGDTFISKGQKASEDMFDSASEQSAIDQIYYVMLGIGIVLAFGVGIILGIQFITSGVAGQAKVKQKLIPYVLGIFIIFGGFGIWRIAINVGKDMFPEEQIDVKLPTEEDKLYVYIEPVFNNTDEVYVGTNSNMNLSFNIKFRDPFNVGLKIKSGDITLTDDTKKLGSVYFMSQGNFKFSDSGGAYYNNNENSIHFDSRSSDKSANGDIATITISWQNATSVVGSNKEIGIKNIKLYDKDGNDVSNRVSLKGATVKVNLVLDGAQSETITSPSPSQTTTTTTTTTTTVPKSKNDN